MNYPRVFSPHKHLQIYLNRCIEEDLFDSVIATLSPEECSLFNKITSPLRQREFLSLRKFLSEVLDKTVNVHYTPHGKPFIAGYSTELSVSHSAGYIAFALNEAAPAGLDIQHPRPQIMRIAQKFLSEDEKTLAGNDLFRTTLIWSAKEAMYKWYSKRKLIFAEDMLVEFGSDQKIEGTLITPEKTQQLHLEYKVFDDLPVVYVL